MSSSVQTGKRIPSFLEYPGPISELPHKPVPPSCSVPHETRLHVVPQRFTIPYMA